jgi:hypothetical protein
MATLTKGKTFTEGEIVTPQKLHDLVGLGSVSNIVNSDISAAAAIADTKLATISTANKVSQSAVTNLTTDLAGKAASSHTHDDRYYTETEMNTLLAGKQASGSYAPATGIAQSAVTNLTTDLAGKAASSHTHDDRYYQKTEVNILLDGKQQVGSYADATHTHGNITNTGAIGSTANLPVVTGSAGQLTTINAGQSGQILYSSGGNSAPFWGNPLGAGNTVITNLNQPNTVVQRDPVGSFYANTGIFNSLNCQDSFTGDILFSIAPSNSGNTAIGLPNVANSTPFIEFYRNGTEVGKIVTSGTSSISYNTSSDYRLKTNIEPLTDALARLLQIPAHRFNWLADPNGQKVDGFLAHEAQAVVPESVAGTKDAVDADGKPIYQGIDQSKLVPLLVAAVQELAARVAALEAK